MRAIAPLDAQISAFLSRTLENLDLARHEIGFLGLISLLARSLELLKRNLLGDGISPELAKSTFGAYAEVLFARRLSELFADEQKLPPAIPTDIRRILTTALEAELLRLQKAQTGVKGDARVTEAMVHFGQQKFQTVGEMNAHWRTCLVCNQISRATLTVVGIDVPPHDYGLDSLSMLERERFSIEKTLHRSPHGVRCVAYDRVLRRRVGLRILDADSMSRQDDIGRFVASITILSQLEQPGIAPIYEVGIDTGRRVYVIGKLVEGQRISDVSQLACGATRAVKGLLDACETLGHAHTKGVIHNHIGCATIVVDDFGAVYVTGWDYASLSGERRTFGDQAEREHTAAFTAPEIATAVEEPVDSQSDIYSLGAVLYKILTGVSPYGDKPGVSEDELFSRLVKEAPVPVRNLAPAAPRELVSVCEKAMARERTDRYGDAWAMARDVRRYLEKGIRPRQV